MRAPRVFVWGVAAALAYFLAGALVWPGIPVRILYEGTAPPVPYRWVHPPANLASGNQVPQGGVGVIGLSPDGSASASILTDDAQAGVIFPRAAIIPRPRVTSVRVRLTPLDPASIAPPPPGLRFDGNAYRMEATYASGEAIALRRPVTPVLRYPVHATALLRSTGAAWAPLVAKRVEAALQIFAASGALGVFVAAGPAPAPSKPWGAYAAVTAGILAAAAAWLFARRSRTVPG